MNLLSLRIGLRQQYPGEGWTKHGTPCNSESPTWCRDQNQALSGPRPRPGQGHGLAEDSGEGERGSWGSLY